VLIERLGGLGDLISLLGSVPELRARHPHSWVVIISPPGSWQLTASSGLSDAASDAGSFFHLFVKIPYWRGTIYRPLLPDEHNPPRPRRFDIYHEFARALGVKGDAGLVQFRTPEKIRKRISNNLRQINPTGCPILVMHAGPTWPVREWPAERWIELSEKISSTSLGCLIEIGTNCDSYGRIVQRTGSIPKAINWVNKLTVMEVVALLEQADVFVGIDSAPLHIAIAVGLPSVGLFGPTLGELTVYPLDKVKLVSSDERCLGCHHSSGGPVHWRTGCPNDIACMAGVHADDVFNALSELLEGRREATGVRRAKSMPLR
jgi:ADP-heptose:LPS heptosyltransferase